MSQMLILDFLNTFKPIFNTLFQFMSTLKVERGLNGGWKQKRKSSKRFELALFFVFVPSGKGCWLVSLMLHFFDNSLTPPGLGHSRQDTKLCDIRFGSNA